MGRTEIRKIGDHKYYAPDRDLLQIWDALMIATGRATADAFDERTPLTEEETSQLGKVLADIGNDAMDKIPAEQVLINFEKALSGLGSEVAAQLVVSLTRNLILLYVNAARDALFKTILSSEQLQAGMDTMSLLSLVEDPEERRRLRALARRATAFVEAFGKVAPLYVVKRKSQDLPEEPAEAKELP